MIQVLVGSEIFVGAVRLHHPELAVIEIERPVVPHGAQVAHLDDADRFDGIQVLREDILLGELHRKLGELQQFLGRGEHLPAVGFGEGLAHPARHGESGMDGPTGKPLQHLGPQMAHVDHLLGNVRGGLEDAHHVPHRIVGVGTDDKVGGRQKVKIEDFVAHVSDALHQAAQFHRGRWRCNAETAIRRLAGDQVMGPGADAADMADRPGHLLYGPTFAKFFKAAEGLDMNLGIGNIARIIQGDGYPAVAFDPGYWLNIDDLAHAFHLLISPVAPAAPFRLPWPPI